MATTIHRGATRRQIERVWYSYYDGLQSNRWFSAATASSSSSAPTLTNDFTLSTSQGSAAINATSEDGVAIKSSNEVTTTSSVKDIKIGKTLDESNAAPYANQVRMLWGNIPLHIRRSFKTPLDIGEMEYGMKKMKADQWIVDGKDKALAILGTWAPKQWQKYPVAYGENFPLAPYRKGQTAAYNYPYQLIPRSHAFRIPLNMDVDPVFQTSDQRSLLRTYSGNFFTRLQGKVTCLLTFSGQPLSGMWTGVEQWRSFWNELPESKQDSAQLFRMHMAEGWFSRRSHTLTKFTLRRQIQEDELFSTFVYRGKWDPETVRTLHAYNQDLPGICLVDQRGYVRWHAVGLPNEETFAVLRPLIAELVKEKRT